MTRVADGEIEEARTVDQEAARFFGLLAVLGDVQPHILLKEINGATGLAKAVRRLLQLSDPAARGRGRPADDNFNDTLVVYVDASVATGETVEGALRRIVSDEGLEDDPNRFETLRQRYRRARRRSPAEQRYPGLVDLFSTADPSKNT